MVASTVAIRGKAKDPFAMQALADPTSPAPAAGADFGGLASPTTAPTMQGGIQSLGSTGTDKAAASQPIQLPQTASAPAAPPNTSIQNPAASPNISTQNWSDINPNSSEMSQALSQFLAAQGANLANGPGNAFSPQMMALMRQNSLQSLTSANQQAQAGAANAGAARGLTGPNLSSILGTQLDATNRGALANADLENQKAGLALGNDQYANLTGAYNALAGANQAEANRAGSETSADYLQQLQGNQATQQQVQDTLDKMGLTQQQNAQSNYNDTLNAYLKFLTDPTTMANFVKGDSKLRNSMEQALEGLQASLSQYGGDLSQAQPQVTFDANGNQIINPGGVSPTTPLDRDQIAAIANSINSPWGTGSGRPRSGPQYIGSQALQHPIDALTSFQTFGQGDANTWSSNDAVNLNKWFDDPANQAAIQALQGQYGVNRTHAPNAAYMNALLQAAQQQGIDFGGYQFK